MKPRPASASLPTMRALPPFLINDGVLPSNEGRGYVLRKIMRRGYTAWALAGAGETFLIQCVRGP